MIPTPVTQPAAKTRPWPTWVALALLWLVSLAGENWIFAILFVGWALYDIAAGESHFIQRITRADHPGTFWLIVLSWIVMSGLWILYL